MGREGCWCEGKSQEVWGETGEWTGQPVDDTDWREAAKDPWEAMEKAVLGGEWMRSVERDHERDGD